MTEGLRLSLDVSAVPSDPVGAGRYTLHLAEALARGGEVSLVLWARRGDGTRWRALTGAAHRPSVGGRAAVATVRAAAPRARLARLAWEQVRLPGLVAGADVDVHHGPHYTMPERARLATVVTVHDLTFFDHPEWHERSKVVVFRRAIRRAAEEADAVVCVSTKTAERLQELCPARGRVFVIPHGIDHARFRPHEPEAGSDDACLARLGVRPPFVVFVGTVEPRKGIGDLVAAFDRVAEENDDLTLVVVGGRGWGGAAVEAPFATARHRDRIVRAGYVPDEAVPALLRRAAVAVYPSHEEGFGLPALEALACGTALVTTAGTAMAEVSGDAAVLVTAGSVAELADAVAGVVDGGRDVEDRRRLGLERAAGYSWERCAEGHLEAYRFVVGHRRSPGPTNDDR